LPVFKYRAKDGPSREVAGVVDAPDHAAAIERIHQMGLAPIHVVSNQRKLTDIERLKNLFGSGRLSDRQLILFSRHLAGFLRNGIPILKAMSIMTNQEVDKNSKKLFESISSKLKEGLTLSDALDRHPKQFPQYFIAMIKSGEKASVLDKSLDILARYLKREARTRTIIKQALTYPTFLFFAGLCAVLFILSYVVPKLTELFDSLGQDLPASTQFIIHLGEWMKFGWIFALIGLGLVFFVLPNKIKSIVGEQVWDSFILKLPILGTTLFKSEFSRFSRALHMSLQNGIPFLTGLDVAIPILQFSNLRHELDICRDAIQKGSRFGEALAKAKAFPPFVTEMISIGEASGNLENMLEEIAIVYEEDVDDKMKYMTNLLEPMMIVVIGGAIAFVVMAMLMPIFDMDVIG
jgi:type IV pilus assembly protein PilC